MRPNTESRIHCLSLVSAIIMASGTVLAACAQSPAPSPKQAEQTPTLREACRNDARTLCTYGIRAEKHQTVQACLKERAAEVSEECRDAFDTRRAARIGGVQAPNSGNGATFGTEYNYGSEGGSPLLTLRYHAATCDTPAPLLVFIHGGAWSVGDKDSGAGVKGQHFTDAGYAFATLNFRLHPDVDVATSTQDIANAIAWLVSQAKALNIDANNIILQGHSSGAHQAALVALDTRYLERAGVDPESVRAVSLLDGAGYDIERQVEIGGNADLYRSVFGDDLSDWKDMSPITYATDHTTSADFILHYVDDRRASEIQSKTLAAAIRAQGKDAEVLTATNKTHASLNRQFGRSGDVPTAEVTAFLKSRIEPCSGHVSEAVD